MTASPHLEPGLLLLLLPLACWPTPGMVGASESVQSAWFCFFCTVVVKPRDLHAFYWLQMAKCGINPDQQERGSVLVPQLSH